MLFALIMMNISTIKLVNKTSHLLYISLC